MCNLVSLNPAWVSAIAAVIYALFTAWMIWEIRKDRKLSYRPIVTADYKNAMFPYNFLFKLKNIGRGPAKIVRLGCCADTGIDWKLNEPMLPISLGSNESIDLRFGIWFHFTSQNYEKAKEVTITAEYHNILGKVYKERILKFKTS